MRAKLIISGLGVVALAVIATLGVCMGGEAMLWRDLAKELPAPPLASADDQYKTGAVSFYRSEGGGQAGHVELASGDIWRFAFRSHHDLKRPDSYSVFSGPLGTYRVRGEHFCCEVQFQEKEMPGDSASFLAFLRSSHPFVAQVQ